jgi:hypothetical protein
MWLRIIEPSPPLHALALGRADTLACHRTMSGATDRSGVVGPGGLGIGDALAQLQGDRRHAQGRPQQMPLDELTRLVATMGVGAGLSACT